MQGGFDYQKKELMLIQVLIRSSYKINELLIATMPGASVCIYVEVLQGLN